MGIIERPDGYERISWKVFAHKDELVFTLSQQVDRLFLSAAEARVIAINFLQGAEVLEPSQQLKDAIAAVVAALPPAPTQGGAPPIKVPLVPRQ